MAAQMSWTDEEDDFLRRALAQGATYSQAAAELEAVFGNGRTANSLIGRAARKGFAFSKREKPSEPKPEKQAKAVKPVAKAPAPKPAARAVPALKPPAKQKHNANNIRVKATRHLDERFDEVRAQRLAEVAAFEAKVDQSGGINPGVLFLEREIDECAAPMPGWDSAPVQAKRVCGAPVEWRPVNIGGITVEQPTSWCTNCRKRFTVPSTDRRADFGKLASLDRSVRRAA
jgi:hypothetical protein